MQHNLQEIAMFTFEEQFKKYEEVIERTQQAYDYWFKCFMTNLKNFTKSF